MIVPDPLTSWNDGIASITVVANGTSGCTTGNTCSIAVPTAGIQATCTATVAGGVITGYTITNPGVGYAAVGGTPPTVTVVQSTCSVLPTGTAVLGGTPKAAGQVSLVKTGAEQTTTDQLSWNILTAGDNVTQIADGCAFDFWVKYGILP